MRRFILSRLSNTKLFKPRVIVGGGPVGSSLAYEFARHGKQVTLINNNRDFGSHNDKSRLVRLAVDGSKTELDHSYQAIQHLLESDRLSQGKVITSKPGMLFIASEGTRLEQQLLQGEQNDKQLIRITEAELATRFPDYTFNFPANTRLWFHPVGYVVDPQALAQTNRQQAELHGCEVLDGDALVRFDNESFQITTDSRTFKTQEVYLLAGARNKEIVIAGNLPVKEFEETTLTAISTVRYQTTMARYNNMPITLGNLKLPGYDYVLDFSTMPESTTTIKTRLSGPGTSERIDWVSDKLNLDDNYSKQSSLNVFRRIFPSIGDPIDFARGVTYRNANQNLNGLSFHVRHTMLSGHNKSIFPAAKLITTLGCNGVHVRYGHSVAKAIYQYDINQVKYNGIYIDATRIQNFNFIENSLPQYRELLANTELREIGQTPVKYLGDNIYLKMEGENLTGSIKDRVALHVLLKKISTGEIKDGDTLILATSGSYGVSVIKIKNIICEHLKMNLNVFIFTPHSYRDKPGIALLKASGIKEVSHDVFQNLTNSQSDFIIYTEGYFADASRYAKSLHKIGNYVYLDQQYDEIHVDAHHSTAKELALQVPEVTDIVVTLGTGATATGIHRFFNKDVIIHSRPAISGQINGLGNPKPYGSFFKAENLQGYQDKFLEPGPALEQRKLLETNYGLKTSASTGAAMVIAHEVKQQNPKAVIAVISPGRF